MSMFRRRKAAVGTAEKNNNSSSNNGSAAGFQPTDEQTQQAKEMMKDNLELMKDIVMKIREDPEFASNIYSNCPRLQHLLDQYPDLRPIFEDPKLVRINFEKVYRDAGGVLPEDEEKKKSLLVRIIESPLFRLLKWIFFFKKLVACIAGGGFALISGCIICCCCEDAFEMDFDQDDLDMDTENVDPMKEALNRAADRMEDPEVQEQMQALLEDPDNLQEAIENDPELRALRDSNPLCEQLMSDPETMKVLTDPDNLRALGECPDLIQADFVDPDGFTPPDVETGGYDGYDNNGVDFNNNGGGGNDVDLSNTDRGFDMDYDGDVDAEEDDGFDIGDNGNNGNNGGVDQNNGGDDGGWWDDAEFEQQDDNNANAANNNNPQANARSQARQQARGAQTRGEAQGAEGNSRFGGIMASVGAAATNMVAAQIVGNFMDATGIGDILGGGGGGGGGVGDMLSGGGEGFSGFADNAGNMMDNDVAGVAEDVGKKVDENKAEITSGDEDRNRGQDDGKKNMSKEVPFGESLDTRSRDNQDEEGDIFVDEAEPDDEPKRGMFGGIMSNLVSAVSTMAKEQVAGAIFGEDIGEIVVEQLERDDNDNDKDNDQANARQEPTGSLFGRRKEKIV